MECERSRGEVKAVQVKDVMMPAAGGIDPRATLREASERLKALDLDPLPVVRDGRVEGLLYEEDVDRRARRDGLAAGSARVSEVMRTGVTCCLAGQTIPDAIARIESESPGDPTRRIPVVDADGTFVGLVALDDLRRREQTEPGEVTAAGAVASIDQLVSFDDDRVDYMSDASFPASDPLPPPSVLGPDRQGEDD